MKKYLKFSIKVPHLAPTKKLFLPVLYRQKTSKWKTR